VLTTGCLALPFLVGLPLSTRGATVKRKLPPVDLSFLDDKVDVVPRAKWAKTVPRPWRLREAGTFDRLTIHHTGSLVEPETSEERVASIIEGVLVGHRNRNYGDIGYHFIVDFAGRAWEGRSLAYEGAHTAGHNEGNIGVMLLGNFEEQAPGRDQLKAMQSLVTALREQYRVKRHRVYGHRDLSQSLCPGRQLYDVIVKLKGEEKQDRRSGI